MRLPFVLLLGLSTSLAAQASERIVPEALRSLLSGPGSCFGEFEQKSATIAAFPKVHFFRGLCVAEHGDSASAIVALDSDGVLFLLESQAAFNFLVARHAPSPFPATPDLEYARAALELAGALGAPAHVVKNPPSPYPKPWTSQNGKTLWTAIFTTTSAGSDGPYYRVWTVSIAQGKLLMFRESTSTDGSE